jgi:hypothetical protein
MDDINALFERLNVSVSYMENGTVDAPNVDGRVLSFSYRAAPGDYCIYIRNGVDKRTREVCDLREKARILYNHFTRPRAQKAQFDEFFRKNMPVIFLRLPEDKNINQRMGMYSTYIYERFAGMAQAMEVNSKLFKDDWPAVRALLEKNMLDGVRRQEYLAYPNENWPAGLSWMTYMIFLCKDMRNSLDAIGGGEGAKIKTGDMSAYHNEISCENQIKEAHETRKTVVEEAADGSGGSDGTDGSGSGDNNGIHIKRGRTTHITGAAASHSVSECDSFEQFIQILRERGIVYRRQRLFTDMLYNSNRNKFNTDIIIPRRLRVIDKTPAELCVLLDVSGSVPVAFVKRIVYSIVKAEGFFNKEKSRLVCWSEGLCSDTPLNEAHKFTSGGSTLMASGIKYCKKYLNENSAFFIVSDFQDDLGDWIRAAKDIKARKTAVAYDDGRYADTKQHASFSDWFSSAGSNANYRKTEVTLKEFTAVFDTAMITPNAMRTL